MKVKPILKWVGGKTQILDKLLTEFPQHMNNYHEPFLGGGSVLLTFISYVNDGKIKLDGKIYAYDLNEPLIYVYKNIQENPEKLYNYLQTIISKLNLCTGSSVNRSPKTIEDAMKSKENYYYWIRSQYNNLSCDEKKEIIGSSMFIFFSWCIPHRTKWV
jgi:DNA adenine methylase